MNYTGTNGLMTRSACWPAPSSSGETIDKIKAWMDEPVSTETFGPNFKKSHLTVGAIAVTGLVAYFGYKKRWFR